LNQYVGYLQTQQVNGSHARIDGIEIGFQQRMSYLPGFLRGFGIAANYSYTGSGASIPWTDSSTNPATVLSRSTPLQRQAPHTLNVSPTYDLGRLSLRLGIQYNSAYIYQYVSIDPRITDINGPTGPNGDDHVYAHTQVDVQGSIRIYHGMKFLAYGLNLTNEPFGHYVGSPQYMIQKEYYKPTYAFGLKYDFGGERSSR
jgi:outer membrane receptor protein involved in Fe transport